MPASIGFRPTPDDERILREAGKPGERTSDTLRRALRLLDHERWLTQFRADAEALVVRDHLAEVELAVAHYLGVQGAGPPQPS